MGVENKQKNSLNVHGRNTQGNNRANTRQKSLLPTLKERQRYLVYELVLPELKNLSEEQFRIVNEDIIKQCRISLGIFDGASSGIAGVKFTNKKLRGIIRIDNTYVDKLKVCLGLIQKIPNNAMNSSIHSSTNSLTNSSVSQTKSSVSQTKSSLVELSNVSIKIIYVSGMVGKAEEKMLL